MPLDRPIPAFYCCYLLRSTIRHGNVYVGSTPHPVRRLRQHNGEARGGAVRTNRPSLRPWEMTCIVTGFPSHIAALQFEWAWQNPHITLHIPPSSRIQHSTAKKRSGHPKRPRHSVASLLSNLHLLLRVPSFSRWPLQLHFFSEDVHKAWLRWTKTQAESIRASIPVVTDFPPEQPVESLGLDPGKDLSGEDGRKAHGIAALDINYAAIKAHVDKAKDVIDFEREGECSICRAELEHDAGIYAICSNPACEAVTHLKCLSTHFLSSESIDEADILVPIKGTCPSCETEHTWVDIVKEATLRMRGQKEIEKLLKKKRVPKGKGKATASQAVLESEAEDEDEEMGLDEAEEEAARNDFVPTPGKENGDVWQEVDDSNSDTGSITSNASASFANPVPRSQSTGKPTSTSTSRPKKMVKIVKQLPIVIEDSDWDDAQELD